MRYLAIDYGERRIGLAISDETGHFASPVGTRERKGRRQDTEAIIETLRGLGAERIVVGLPRNLQGGAGESEAALRKFVEALRQGLQAAGRSDEIEWWDERFSTREALNQMRAAGVSQREGRATSGSGSVDARAAAIILQGFLDWRRAQSETGPATAPMLGEEEMDSV